MLVYSLFGHLVKEEINIRSPPPLLSGDEPELMSVAVNGILFIDF